MVRVRAKTLTRANVLQVGLSVVLIGVIGYSIFLLIGIEESNAVIASQLILVFILFGWTGSYLFRVFTGKMTFVEQRKRYLEAYEKLTSSELQAQFEAMSEEEQNRLLNDLDSD